MSNYATWANYQAYYGSITDEAEFNRLNHKVSGMIDVLTGNRAAAATGYKHDRLDDCACDMIDYMQSVDSSGAGRGITSVSNDGYSESYAAVTPDEVKEQYRQKLFNWLSGTGLMGAL